MKITVMGASGQIGTKVVALLNESTTTGDAPSATYFGTAVGDTSLVTGDDAVLAGIALADWLASQ